GSEVCRSSHIGPSRTTHARKGDGRVFYRLYYSSDCRGCRDTAVMKFIRSLYIGNLFYYALLGMAAVDVLSYYWEWLRPVATGLRYIWLAALCWDVIFLVFPKNKINIQRRYPEKLSNGDANSFVLLLKSTYPRREKALVLEELPMQLQVRDNEYRIQL